MSLGNWVKNSWLEQRDSDAAEIARLLALADGRLEDYQRAVAGKLSSDVQLGLAYDAIRISAKVALRAAGYRVVRGGSEHYRTIEALEFRLIRRRNSFLRSISCVESGISVRTMTTG
jgi:hypothetical protein